MNNNYLKNLTPLKEAIAKLEKYLPKTATATADELATIKQSFKEAKDLIKQLETEFKVESEAIAKLRKFG